MKRFLYVFLIIISLLMITGKEKIIKAAGEDIASGYSIGINWRITSNGELIIGNGNSQVMTLNGKNGNNQYSYPWDKYRSRINSVRFDGDVYSGTYIGCMFYKCVNLATVNLQGFHTVDARYMNCFFQSCPKLVDIYFGDFDVSNIELMRYVFDGCKALQNLDLTSWNTEKATDMQYLFRNCSQLTSLNLSSLNTSRVTNMKNMFDGCSSLGSLILGENFSFKGAGITEQSNQAVLPTLSGSQYSGTWIRKDEEYGPYTSEELRDHYAAEMAGVWVRGIKDNPYAVFDETTGTLSFVKSKEVHANKTTGTVRSISGGEYTGTIFAVSENGGDRTWDSVASKVEKIVFVDEIKPTSTARWFSYFTKAVSFDLAKLNMGKVKNMESMFLNCESVEELDLSGFDTSSVTNMRNSLRALKRCKSLNVSGWDTSNVTDMSGLFYEEAAYKELDLSSFDKSKVTKDGIMFPTSGVRKLILGEKWRFVDQGYSSESTLQPQKGLVDGVTYTGKWIRDDETYGPYSVGDFMKKYTPDMAGTWVWEEKPVNYTVKFLPPDNENYGGSMPDQKINAAEAGTLNENSFYRFNYHFDHWNGSDSRTYEDKAVIPATTFKVGDVLTLTAVFEKDDNHLAFTDGEAEITLHAGEKVVLPDLPGGMTYQVYEETPGGWQLVDQTNTAGIVPANGIADSSFVNEYVPGTATISLIAQKTLDGRAPADGQFTFELLQGDEVVQTVSNNAAGMVTFDQLVFKQPGTFIYKIREVRGEDNSISYDSHVETITITVEDDGHGNLTATKSIGDTVPSFANETKPGTLQVSKEAVGGTGEDVFTFEITLTDGYGRSLEDVTILSEYK